jgi:hypothetical protein
VKFIFYFYDDVVKSASALMEARSREEIIHIANRFINKEFIEKMGYGIERFKCNVIGAFGERGEFCPFNQIHIDITFDEQLPDDDKLEQIIQRLPKSFDYNYVKGIDEENIRDLEDVLNYEM